MLTRELMQQALEALDGGHIERAYGYIQEALAQPEEQQSCDKQKPVAWWDAKLGVFDEKQFDQLQPLYTSPPQRKWVGLTGKETDECEECLGHVVSSQVFDVIEDKLKEKNK